MADTRGTVLVVDDDPATVELLADYLIGKQLTVARAHTLDETLAELDRERPEIALIGVRLGDSGPLEAIKRIREVNVQVALLATAAQEDADLATEALGMGAADYLLKPVDFDYLSRAVEKALAAAAPVFDFTAVAEAPSTSSPQTLLYTLGLEIFRATRRFSPEARASVGGALEQVVLQAMQRGVTGEKAEVIRTLNQVRTLIRFAQDLGDLDAETAARIEEHMARARRSVGLS
jgi:DNA-binding response OmpR family regulator